MSLQQAHKVSPGARIEINGETFEVKNNVITDLVLNKVVGPIKFQEDLRASQLIPTWIGHKHLVEVERSAQGNLTTQLRAQFQDQEKVQNSVKEDKPSLTEQLRKQKAQQDLAQSLRDQVEDQEEEEEEEYEFDFEFDNEGDEDSATEEEPVAFDHNLTLPWADVSSISATDVSVSGTLEDGNQAALNASLEAKKASKEASKANFKADAVNERSRSLADELRQNIVNASQANRKTSEEAVDRAIEAQDSADEAHKRLDLHQESFNYLTDEVENVVDQANDAFYQHDQRISALERKQKEEERNVNLQEQLNQSVAARKQQSDVQAQLDEKLKEKQGGNKMKNILGNFKNQFGKIEGVFAFSPATGGLAIRKGLANQYVAYDAKTGAITDVQDMVVEANVPAFKLPTAANDVKKGDIVLNNGSYQYVTAAHDGYVDTVDPVANTRGAVQPVTNIVFGKPFYTVVKTADIAGKDGFNPALLMAMGKGNKDDILPFLLAQGGFGGAAKNGQIDPTMLMMLGDNIDDILPLVLMQQGGVANGAINPLMFLAMDKKGEKNDLLPLLLSQQAGGQIDPMTMMMLGDGSGDMKDFFMIQALSGQNAFGGKVQDPGEDSNE